jgi:hypothetical protein
MFNIFIERDVTLWFLIGRCVYGNYDCGPGRMNGRKHKLANRQIIQLADVIIMHLYLLLFGSKNECSYPTPLLCCYC